MDHSERVIIPNPDVSSPSLSPNSSLSLLSSESVLSSHSKYESDDLHFTGSLDLAACGCPVRVTGLVHPRTYLNTLKCVSHKSFLTPFRYAYYVVRLIIRKTDRGFLMRRIFKYFQSTMQVPAFLRTIACVMRWRKATSSIIPERWFNRVRSEIHKDPSDGSKWLLQFRDFVTSCLWYKIWRFELKKEPSQSPCVLTSDFEEYLQTKKSCQDERVAVEQSSCPIVLLSLDKSKTLDSVENPLVKIHPMNPHNLSRVRRPGLMIPTILGMTGYNQLRSPVVNNMSIGDIKQSRLESMWATFPRENLYPTAPGPLIKVDRYMIPAEVCVYTGEALIPLHIESFDDVVDYGLAHNQCVVTSKSLDGMPHIRLSHYPPFAKAALELYDSLVESDIKEPALYTLDGDVVWVPSGVMLIDFLPRVVRVFDRSLGSIRSYLHRALIEEPRWLISRGVTRYILFQLGLFSLMRKVWNQSESFDVFTCEGWEKFSSQVDYKDLGCFTTREQMSRAIVEFLLLNDLSDPHLLFSRDEEEHELYYYDMYEDL